MKKLFVTLSLVAVTGFCSARVIPFHLSPPGVSAAVGLSPSNELHTVNGRSGSGGEILSGITYDTDTMTLNLAVGYGSIALFSDLTGPVTAVHIHGPATASEEASVLVNLMSLHIPAGDPSRGGLLFGSVDLDENVASNLLAGLTYVNFHTATNTQGEIRGQLIPSTAPYIIACADPQILECESRRGAVATLTARVADPDGDALKVVWYVDGNAFQTNRVPAGDSLNGVGVQFHGAFGLGTHDVLLSVTDRTSEPVTCSTTVTVQDTIPPVIESITANPSVLWPPNHKMATVKITVRATDACGPLRARIADVFSNEDLNGTGDGNTSYDWRISRNTGDRTDWRIVTPLRVKLRKERSGNGSGRDYTIVVEVRDAAGNAARGRVHVTVPHDKGKGKGSGKNGTDDKGESASKNSKAKGKSKKG
jgi:CHRD domain